MNVAMGSFEALGRLGGFAAGVGVVSYGLVLMGVAYLMDCVREITKNTRWQVPEAQRPRRSFAGLAVIASLVGISGVVLFATGLLLALGSVSDGR